VNESLLFSSIDSREPRLCEEVSVRILTGLLAVALVPAVAQAGAPPAKNKTAAEAERVAKRIDHHINAQLTKANLKPGPVANDAMFLRRLTLDVGGKIPAVNDLRRFMGNRAPDKRARAIDDLLDSKAYVNNFTTIWLNLLIPEAAADFQRRFLMPSMDAWLRRNFNDNTPYDKMVRDLVAMPFKNNNQGMRYSYYDDNPAATPMGFYLAKAGKPEDIAANVTRLFLGIRLECAQCHDHPFATWTREQFWSQAAFFAGIKGPKQDFVYFGQLREVADRREMNIPNTDRVAQAAFLDGSKPKWKYKVGARDTLADWMVAKDNPFFARTMVNRMWAHFFGVGLVDPVDDFNNDNAPSHGELLKELAKEFAGHDYDIKFLIRAITLSQAYQRSSVALPGEKPEHLRLFARMPIKGMMPHQFFESLCQSTGYRDYTPLRQRIYSFGQPRQEFEERFAAQDRRTEYHTSIPQALTMMNNKFITEQTDPTKGFMLGAIIEAPFLKVEGKVEAMFLAALSRKPTTRESEKMLRHVTKTTTTKDRNKALSDVFWSLLNSTEFRFNH